MSTNEARSIDFLSSSLEHIEQCLGHTFQNKGLLFQAFVHKSFLNECSFAGLVANERLEFLGDAVLDLYVSSFLFSGFSAMEEGKLSQCKARLVCQESCAHMMQQLGLVAFLIVGKGELVQLTKERPSVASDLLEAIIGAIFVDGGWPAAEKFLFQHFSAHFESLSQAPSENAKAKLQEYFAKQGRPIPEYRLNEASGAHHEQLFFISVFVEGVELGRASARTKREAERLAAAAALSLLEDKPAALSLPEGPQ